MPYTPPAPVFVVAGHVFAHVAARPDTSVRVRDGIPVVSTVIDDNPVDYVIRPGHGSTRVEISAFFPAIDDDLHVGAVSRSSPPSHVVDVIDTFETDVRNVLAETARDESP